jgi:flagellar hook protein FlgE
MTAIPHAAEALTSALDRFGHASARVLEAVTGADDVDLGESLVDMMKAKVQAKASVAVIRFSDEMWDALIEIGKERDER